MSDNIHLGEIIELYPLNVPEYHLRLFKTRHDTGRKVDLSYITRNYDL